MDIIAKLDRAHRMSCSDPDDPNQTTLYSDARDELRSLTEQLRTAQAEAIREAAEEFDARKATLTGCVEIDPLEYDNPMDMGTDIAQSWLRHRANLIESGGVVVDA